MKFGEQLRSSLIRDWYYHYISYDDLKDGLKTVFETPPTSDNPDPKRRPWTEKDEQRFVKLLEQELDKVYTFQKVKSEEIVRRIQASEKEVGEVVTHATQLREEQGQEQADEALEEDFMLLEEDVSDIIADVHDLASFTRLNYTGFQKIIKKHDKQTKWHLRPVFAVRLKAKPFYRDNYDAFIIKVSRLYDLVRTRGSPTKGDAGAGGKQQNFIRNTTKYWVHPDNITELKLVILKHLPVLVFNPSKEFEKKDSAISSIYYDNTDTWELYEGRLQKTEGAEAIRLRWYGGMEAETIFVERKTHREDWTGEKSVKARFPLKENKVNDYLAGRLTVDKIFEKMRREGKKPEKEINDLEQLAREIQYRVLTRSLVPVTRSYYSRTAFQLPGDARVRISLDIDLSMIREDNLDDRQRAGTNWRRTDIGIDHPFRQLPPSDIERFPYAILEVKLQTAAGQLPPEWIRELTASHLVEAVPKFSKFIHGTAALQPERIALLPFWMPQMDVDILKPVSRNFGIERPGQVTDMSTSDTFDDSDDEDLPKVDNTDPEGGDVNQRRLHDARRMLRAHERVQDASNEDIDDDRDDDDEAQPRPDGREHADEPHATHDPNTLDEEERVAASPIDEDYVYESDPEAERQYELEQARKKGRKAKYALLATRWEVSRAAKRVSQVVARGMFTPGTEIPTGGRELGVPHVAGEMKRFQAPPGKRIHVPIRVEPKVHLANERTFLSWLEFSILLGSIAAALLNFGDRLTLAASIAFTVVALVALIYSAVLYYMRVDAIRARRVGRRVYYEKWGPTVLCGGVLGAMAVGFVFRLVKGGEGGLKG
ncbi:SPX-domain-containing protein [Eremomyces bilateralis CBS 781.70]|uniref:Vacuolar transporter chaperone complex subunit 4 n=1 Tax=Eremomyces bilateralis CBS 781.70 TaxID=1392243 RepID=A0A6G1FUE4_9PEZI|nr:SPX-domain-containing protein [Eremomyces bilateralis CBS 781.70]KAF1809427.1 SPX-domain-containing protein [Eremomyces bilateralis CBS 781.70]